MTHIRRTTSRHPFATEARHARLPTRRFQSTWMGLIVHAAPSLLIFGVVLDLVL